MAITVRSKRNIFLTALIVFALLTIGALLTARPTEAILQWEPQKPPASFQGASGAKRFNAIEYIKSPMTGTDKYYSWVVGNKSDEKATIIYYNGSFWQELKQTELGSDINRVDLYDVAMFYSESETRYMAFAVGENGRILYFPDGVNLCETGAGGGVGCPSSPSVETIMAVDALQLYSDMPGYRLIVGDALGGIWIAEPQSYDTTAEFGMGFNADGAVTDVYALDTSHAWAVTANGKIYFKGDYADEMWSEYDANIVVPGIEFSAISAGNAGNIWAVGKDSNGIGVVLYSQDGQTWDTQALPVLEGQIIPALTGVSAYCDQTLGICNAYTVGQIDVGETGNGAIFQYNGSQWERGDSNDSGVNLMDISAASLTEVKAVGGYIGNDEKSMIITSSPGNIFGWLWFGASTQEGSKDSVGWGSGSCANQTTCNSAGFTYGVNVQRSGRNAGALSGQIWLGGVDPQAYIPDDCRSGACASNPEKTCSSDSDCRCGLNTNACYSLGWLSFNKYGPNGVDIEAGTPPENPYRDPLIDEPYPYVAKFDSTSGRVEGWGRLLSMKTDAANGGWVKLRGNNFADPDTVGTVRDCKNCGSFCSTSGAKCQILGTACDDGRGTCRWECKLCNATMSLASISCNRCVGVPQETTCQHRCTLDPTRACTDGCAPGDTCSDEYFCATCETCDQYGVSVDDASGRVTGYAWSGNETTAGELGWIDFNRANYYSQAWLQTSQGDIYARANIGSSGTPTTPMGKCNATYIISAAGTITNFCSDYGKPGELTDEDNPPEGERPYWEQNAGEINFPDSSFNYTNVLGRLEVEALTDAAPDGKNKYGDEVVLPADPEKENATLSDFPDLCGTNIELSGRVFYAPHNLTIESGGLCQGFVVNNGQGLQRGSGTIVVEGNLFINLNMSYDQGAPIQGNDISKLASLGIIVKEGAMTVGGEVDSIVGSYIVFSNAPIYAHAQAAGITIANSLTDRPFSAQGLMIARSFQFRRTYRGTLIDPQPAESINYDGRVIANPPPGFQDFAKALPVIREIAPIP